MVLGNQLTVEVCMAELEANTAEKCNIREQLNGYYWDDIFFYIELSEPLDDDMTTEALENISTIKPTS